MSKNIYSSLFFSEINQYEYSVNPPTYFVQGVGGIDMRQDLIQKFNIRQISVESVINIHFI